MARIIDTIITSHTPPQQTNVLWDNGELLLMWRTNKWVPIGTIGEGDTSAYRPYIAYSNSSDGVEDFTRQEDLDSDAPSLYTRQIRTSSNSAETDFKYTGIAVSFINDVPTEPNQYTWSKTRGTDGIDGEVGPQGPQGIPGKDGKDGKPGLDAILYKNVVAFKSSTTTPSTPEGGYWDVANDIITLPEGWSNTDNIEKPIWMSDGTFSSSNPSNPTWTTPVCISGTDGVNGADGVSSEFIYRRTETSLDDARPDTPESVNVSGHVPEYWEPSPLGITEELQCEWVSSRKKDSNGNWSVWSTPSKWSVWGVKGTDGDGVQYIFQRNAGMTLDNPSNSIDINSDEYQEKGEFEGIEYVPTELGWYDNPAGVTEVYTHEWVCQRKYRDGVWGAYSNPALWAKYGDVGKDGIGIKVMYAVTSGSDVVPEFVKDNTNPGSIWSFGIPNYDSPEALWAIEAYMNYKGEFQPVEEEDGTIIIGWQGPILKTGVAGIDGLPPNYKIYFYKLSDTQPEPPTFTDPTTPTDNWIDYPNSAGQWWQCVGTVNGLTNTIDAETGWSVVLPLNGQDGEAKDGKHWEVRFAASTDDYSPGIADKTAREPLTSSGESWIKVDVNTAPPEVPEGGKLWKTEAEINPDDTLVSGWCEPYSVSGERGPRGYSGATGEQGPQGLTGIPGVSFEIEYTLGTSDSYNDNSWQSEVPTTTSEYMYIWCRQGKRVYESADDTEGSVTFGNPFRLTGINGLDGDGSNGLLVYPAGIYDSTKTYSCTETTAPYVFDPNSDYGGGYYVLNTTSWEAGQVVTPADSYAIDGGKYWQKLDHFEAMYAQIGVFGQALVGSAVFYDTFMFSQQGIDSNGVSNTNYHLFDKDDPFGKDKDFYPNIFFNFATGEFRIYKDKLIVKENGKIENLLGEIYLYANDSDLTYNISCAQNQNIKLIAFGHSCTFNLHYNYEESDYSVLLNTITLINDSEFTTINIYNDNELVYHEYISAYSDNYKNANYHIKLFLDNSTISSIQVIPQKRVSIWTNGAAHAFYYSDRVVIDTEIHVGQSKTNKLLYIHANSTYGKEPLSSYQTVFLITTGSASNTITKEFHNIEIICDLSVTYEGVNYTDDNPLILEGTGVYLIQHHVGYIYIYKLTNY